MKKEQIILELIKSLNQGNTSDYQDRVKMALKQYEQMVDYGIIEEDTKSE